VVVLAFLNERDGVCIQLWASVVGAIADSMSATDASAAPARKATAGRALSPLDPESAPVEISDSTPTTRPDGLAPFSAALERALPSPPTDRAGRDSGSGSAGSTAAHGWTLATRRDRRAC